MCKTWSSLVFSSSSSFPFFERSLPMQFYCKKRAEERWDVYCTEHSTLCMTPHCLLLYWHAVMYIAKKNAASVQKTGSEKACQGFLRCAQKCKKEVHVDTLLHPLCTLLVLHDRMDTLKTLTKQILEVIIDGENDFFLTISALFEFPLEEQQQHWL